MSFIDKFIDRLKGNFLRMGGGSGFGGGGGGYNLKTSPFLGVIFSLMRNVRGVKIYEIATAV